jgi:hypothetical protein
MSITPATHKAFSSFLIDFWSLQALLIQTISNFYLGSSSKIEKRCFRGLTVDFIGILSRTACQRPVA